MKILSELVNGAAIVLLLAVALLTASPAKAQDEPGVAKWATVLSHKCIAEMAGVVGVSPECKAIGKAWAEELSRKLQDQTHRHWFIVQLDKDAR